MLDKKRKRPPPLNSLAGFCCGLALRTLMSERDMGYRLRFVGVFLTEGGSNLQFGVCASPVGGSVGAEWWKAENVGKQAASKALRSGGIEMASNRLFRLRTPRTPPMALPQRRGHSALTKKWAYQTMSACPPGQPLFSDQRKEEKALWKDC